MLFLLSYKASRELMIEELMTEELMSEELMVEELMVKEFMFDDMRQSSTASLRRSLMQAARPSWRRISRAADLGFGTF